MNTVTLNEYRALIMQAERSAVRAAQTVLPRSGALLVARDHGYTGLPRPQAWWRPGDRPYVDAVLDLTDPGTAHALIPLLALAHGRDPGPGGRGVRWTGLRDADGQRYGWWLSGDPIVPITEPYYIAYVPEPGGDDLEIVASNIANEPDDLAALVMAVRHVLGQP